MADNTDLIELSSEALIFYHVALLHGFRAAGTHLGISKSVISAKVSSLESRLGRKLLYRSTRDVSLTPEGEIYLEQCRNLLTATQKLKHTEREFKAGLSGSFTISAPHDFTNVCLVPLIQKLQSLHPKLSLNLVASDQVMNLEKSKVDLAIRVDAEGAGHLYRTQFFKAEFGFYALEGLARTRKNEKEVLKWLSEEGVSVFRRGFEKSVKLGDKNLDLKLNSKIQVNDVLSLKSLILAGFGVGILPCFSVRNEVESGTLVKLLPNAVMRTASFIFLSGVKRQEDSRLNAVIEFLQSEMQN